MSDELLALAFRRQEIRNAVLGALLAESAAPGDAGLVFQAWKEVDEAAKRLAAARRRYERHVREAVRKANMPAGREPVAGA